MTGWGWIGVILAVAAIGALFVPFRWNRREREYRERGQAASIVRAGLMEVQNLLEPEKKIAIVREVEQDREHAGAPAGRQGERP